MWFTNPIALIKIFDSSFPELKDASSIGATKRTIRSENIIKINIFSNIGQGCVQRERGGGGGEIKGGGGEWEIESIHWK